DDLPSYPLGYPTRTLLAYFKRLRSFSEVTLIDDVTCRVQHLIFDESCPDKVFKTTRAFNLFTGVPDQRAIRDAGQHVLGKVERLAIGDHIGQYCSVFQCCFVEAVADAIEEQT